jgi:tetratricopeptide (TPR) repeat protein
MIAPGQEVTVTLRIRYVRKVKPEAVALNEQGEKLLFTRRSSLSLLNLIPVERKQSEGDLRRAAALFTKALAIAPDYVEASYHLGQVSQLLLEHGEAVKHFERALAIDPAHVAARVEYAAVLIEDGDADEAIRQLTEVQRLEPANDEAHSMLARAYWDKGAWAQAVAAADKALALSRTNAQAHLWKADATRQLAAADPDKARQFGRFADAREGYREFLRLTNFSTGLGAKLAFSFIGFGVGTRRHADRQGAYDSLRSSGFLGLCITEARVGNALRAREYCQRAIGHAPKDPIAHFLLGNIHRDLYNVRQSCGDLAAARASYAKMLALNPDLEESKNARNYVGQIDGILPQLGCATR